jgi:hypothetical protein
VWTNILESYQDSSTCTRSKFRTRCSVKVLLVCDSVVLENVKLADSKSVEGDSFSVLRSSRIQKCRRLQLDRVKVFEIPNSVEVAACPCKVLRESKKCRGLQLANALRESKCA